MTSEVNEVNEVKNNNQLFLFRIIVDTSKLQTCFVHLAIFENPSFAPLCLHVSWSMTQGNVDFMTRYLRAYSLAFEDNLRLKISFNYVFIILEKYLLCDYKEPKFEI